MALQPVITSYGVQSGTDRTLYFTWTWAKDGEETKDYTVEWQYDTGDGTWFLGVREDVTFTGGQTKQHIYTAPDNAEQVRFRVSANPNETSFVGTVVATFKNGFQKTTSSSWSKTTTAWTVYNLSSAPPQKPPTPTVSIKNGKLTASLENIDLNAHYIKFQVYKTGQSYAFAQSGNITITTVNSASYTCNVNPGAKYRVRCCSGKNSMLSEWSDFSQEYDTSPSAPTKITSIKATSETSVRLDWNAVGNAESYEIQYATKKEYFDGSDQVNSATGIEYNHYEKTGLESGQEYFFRVRAVNTVGQSGWSEIKSITIGKKPSAPTTWSSTTTAVVGEPLTLYWVHNTIDGSSQVFANLELIIDGVKTVQKIQNSTDEDEKDKTSTYNVNTSTYKEGAKIYWRVQTAGVTGEVSDWSTQRTIDLYAKPTLSLQVADVNNNDVTTLESFPFNINMMAGPDTQTPIGYHLSIISDDDYSIYDNIGNETLVIKGQEVFSKVYDVFDNMSITMKPGDVNLMNNMSYIVKGTVTMNSGLSAEATDRFTVAWVADELYTDAQMIVDSDTLTVCVCPYCTDANGNLVEDVELAIYRRDYDGGMTELYTDLSNSLYSFYTDPHPALDYGRYRIVATSTNTGTVYYNDVRSLPINGKSIVIQWDEQWTDFDTVEGHTVLATPWSGSMLTLPYDIDITENYDPDVTLVNYIGRKHPVSYYGTQKGSTATWTTKIPKTDTWTIAALRKLSNWTGDAYVREPSGSGYWANVKVSFSIKHLETSIPVTLTITRVEGGM